MDTQPQDQMVIDLLGKLKEANSGYPASMLAARRALFMKQAANVALGLGAGAVLKDAAKGNGAGASTTVASKILEITLVAAIAIEAGTVAFLYRDQIADAVRGFFDPIPVVTTQPTSNAPLPETVGDLQTLPITITAPASLSATPSGTPGPVSVQEATPSSDGSNGNTSTNINANATPNPNENQGNQYGLTPKPDRTKENQGGGNNPGNNGGNDNGNNGNNGNR